MSERECGFGAGLAAAPLVCLLMLSGPGPARGAPPAAGRVSQAAGERPGAAPPVAGAQPRRAARSEPGFSFRATLDKPAIEPLLRQIFTDREGLREQLDVPGSFTPGFLDFVARTYAQRIGGLPAGRRPLGGQVLAGLNGRPTALALVYGVEPEGLTRERVARRLGEGLRQTVRLLNAEEHGAAQGALSLLALPELFRTVIVGASPRSPSLVSWRAGLPPAVYGPVARKMAADHRRLPIGEVAVVRAFYEPRLAKDLEFGVLLRAPVSAAAAEVLVYLTPSPSFPLGRVLSRDHYARVVNRLRRPDAAGAPLSEPVQLIDAGLSEPLARGWGGLAARYGAPTAGATCRQCRASDVQAMTAGADEFRRSRMTGAPRLEAAAADEPGRGRMTEAPRLVAGSGCTVTYQDGTTGPLDELELGVESCAEISATVWSQVCCQTDVQRGYCLASCECPPVVSSHDTVVGGRDRFLQGVPVFFQHVMPDMCSSLLGSSADAFSGCGPVAGAMLAAWYDSLGHTGLGAGFRQGGKLDWRALVEELRREMGSPCSPCFCNPHQTYTMPVSFRRGLEDFFTDRGLDVEVRRFKVKEDPRAGDPDQLSVFEGWQLIRTELEADRPVPILYCLLDGCDGLGFKDVDIDILISHYGLITGAYELDGKSFIHVDKGHGRKQNEVYEWEIPKGAVRLFTLKVLSDPAGESDCVADYEDEEAMQERFLDPFLYVWNPFLGEVDRRLGVYFTDSDREFRWDNLGQGGWVIEHEIAPQRCLLQKDKERVETLTLEIDQVRGCFQRKVPEIDLVIDCEETPWLFGCDGDILEVQGLESEQPSSR